MGYHLALVVVGVVATLCARVSAQAGPGPFSALACDGSSVYLSCQPGHTIQLRDVFYGRNDSATCRQTGRDSSTQCAAPGARDSVVPLCQDKQNCLVRASDALFGVPAPCTGRTSKVLLITYVCALAQNTALLCEGSGRLTLTCPTNQVLEIQSAFYGRDDLTTCPHRTASLARGVCRANSTLDIVNITCSGLKDCELIARSGLFGDPCPNNLKYLRVVYSCVACENYHNSSAQCDQWALEGQCIDNPVYMKDQCFRSCSSCDTTTPTCSNRMREEDCDFWAGRGDCMTGDFVAWMMVNCRKSCTRCDRAATCQNTWQATGNSSCAAREADGGCWRDPAFMLVNCAGSCLCPANRQNDRATVRCENSYEGLNPNATDNDPDADCRAWVALGDCTTNPGFMYKFCFRSCTNCTATPVCENKADDANCDVYLEQGECRTNPLWMFENCWRACTGCTPEPVCTNTHGNDAECEYWRGQGRCNDNPEFMTRNCWKTCSRCQPKPNAPVCRNDFGVDADCDGWRDNGDCNANPSWMMPYCRKSCTFCGFPYLQHTVQGSNPLPGEASLMTRGRTFVLPGAFRENGTLSHFTVFFTNKNAVTLEILRPDGRANFRVISSTMITPTVSKGPQTVPVDGCVEVRVGDRIGFSSMNNRPAPVAYRFDLNAVGNFTSFRTAFSRAQYDSMKLPYVFSLGAAYDHTRTSCSAS